MELTSRQNRIIEIVKENEPINSEDIANELGISRSTIRTDLSLLTMVGILDAKPKVGYVFASNFKEDFSKSVCEVLVGEVKSMPVVVDEKMSIYDGIVTMFLEDAGTIFVVTDGYLSGVISRKDFLKSVIGGSDVSKVPVGVIMTRMPNIVYLEESDTILFAARKIINHEIDSVPVIKKIYDGYDEKLVITGRISKTTITKVFVDIIEGEK